MLIINIIGLSILGIFFLFVLSKKKKKTSDFLLMLSIFLFGCMLFSYILTERGYSAPKYIFQILVNVYFFPSILIYGLVLIDDEHKLQKTWWWIPSFAIIFTVFLVLDFSFLNDYDTPDKVKELYESPTLIYKFFYKFQYIFVIGTLSWYLKKIKNYKAKIKDNFSFIDPINLNWLKNFSLIYIFLHIVSLIFILASDFNIINNIKIPFGILFIGVMISLYYLCYKGIRHYAVADFKELNEYNRLLEKKKKYKSSSLSDEEMNALFDKIKFQFEQELIYLEPQLKIDKIAKEFGVTTHKISQTINSKAGKPFYDFVNQYRAEHFKRLLSNPENRKYTILALGIESGFNSKASLNRIFKQNTGISPKEFQKRQYNL